MPGTPISSGSSSTGPPGCGTATTTCRQATRRGGRPTGADWSAWRGKPASPETQIDGGAMPHPLLVGQAAVVEIGVREKVLLGPVVLAVLPLWLVAPLGKQAHRAHQVAGIEVLRIDPGQDRHVGILRPEPGRDPPGPPRGQVDQETADQIAHQVGPQRPARPEVPEDPREVRNAR